MKKFVTAMVIILVLGVVLCGIGCAVYFTGDNRFFSEQVQYTECSFVAEEAFETVDFDLKQSHRICFKAGDAYSVRYFDSEQSPVSVSSQNGTVSIKEQGFDFKHWWDRLKYRFGTTDVEITVPAGTVLSLKGNMDGATDLQLPSWEFGNMALIVRGSANIMGTNVSTQDINFDISGAANLMLSGSFKNINVSVSGSVNIEVNGTANSLTSHASGSLDIAANSFICPLVDLSASGSLGASLSGSGEVLKLYTSGSGDLFAKNFTVEEADLGTSGSLDAEVSVSRQLTVKASGSATVYYWGDPHIDRHVSGYAKITKRG